MATFSEWLALKRLPRYFTNPKISGFVGVTLGLTADEAAETQILACRMHLLDDPESPDDVLPYLARDRKLPRYPGETAAQHRARLIAAWEIYDETGTEEVIEKQLLAAGYGPDVFIGDFGNPDVAFGDPQYFFADRGAYVDFRPDETGPRGEAPPYRTQFWVVFGEGFHPVVGPPIPWGDFVWGDTSVGVWGPQGYDREFQQTIEGIVRKWKPHDYVFRGFTFVINNIPFGDESVSFGDETIIFGGTYSVDVPLR